MERERTPSTARLGRPRRDQRPRELEPTEEILQHAGRLFAAQGFEATTTRQIAEAAGLRQGGLFHYFARKDDIFAELLDRTVEPPLAIVDRIDGLSESSAARLWALTTYDVTTMCTHWDLASLWRLPYARQPQFSDAFAKRKRLFDVYERYLLGGQAEAELQFEDIRYTADFIFGVIEAPPAWFESGTHDPVRVAELTGWTVLRSLIVSDSLLAAVIESGRRITERLKVEP